MAERKNIVSAYVPELSEFVIDQGDSPKIEGGKIDVSVGLVFILVNVMVTVIVFTGMAWHNRSIPIALLASIAYFLISTVCVIFINSGELGRMWAAWLYTRVEERRIDAQYRLARMVLRQRILGEMNEQLRLSEPATQSTVVSSNFVAPYDNSHYTQAEQDTTRIEALRWVRGLYGADGLPDAKRVRLTSGMIIGKVIGSNRGEGSSEACAWLVNKGVLRNIGNNYALNLKRFPRVENIRSL